jgi:hypothetical protein
MYDLAECWASCGEDDMLESFEPSLMSLRLGSCGRRRKLKAGILGVFALVRAGDCE